MLLHAGSNVTSVAEDEVMRILVLIRNYLPARDQIVSGKWDVPAVAVNSWDLIDKTVGTVGGGRIGYHMMKRLRVGAPAPPPPTHIPLGPATLQCDLTIEGYVIALYLEGLQELHGLLHCGLTAEPSVIVLFLEGTAAIAWTVASADMKDVFSMLMMLCLQSSFCRCSAQLEYWGGRAQLASIMAGNFKSSCCHDSISHVII